MFPDFIVIGAAKCGTTSLCDLLGSHPEIFFSNPKEPRYFSNTERFGTAEFRDWYESLFAEVNNEKRVGEGTTTYTHPEIAATVAGRIREAIPHCRLIFMARHPIRRLESDWRMRHFEGWAPGDINEAVRDNPSLITHSLYHKNLEAYRRLFPKQQLKVVLLEDLSADPADVLRDCLGYLDVDPDIDLNDPGRRRNESAGFRKDSKLSANMRRSALLTRIRDRLPDGVVRTVKRLLTKQVPYEPQWQDDCLRDVVEQIRDDATCFLADCGRPADFWRLGGEGRSGT